MPEKRGVRDFQANGEVWSAVDDWAGAQGYKVAENSEGRRTYKKGSGFFAGARAVEIESEAKQVHLEAWAIGNMPARILSLGILPAEVTIESGGPQAVLPRKMGRDEVNQLLAAFGQPAFE